MLRRFLPVVLACAAAAAAGAQQSSRYFGIEVVDEQTGRGVPLVELRTTGSQRYYTDSGGLVALDEPGFNGREVYFSVSSHGYEAAADGFGFRGARLKVEPGQVAQIKIRRRNIAERLYRLTGEGIYRDTLLLGRPAPIKNPVLNAEVTGCDSVQNAVYQGRLFWMWGDTGQLRYPLGGFQMTGATSALPGKGGLDPSRGVDLEYFTGSTGFAREMAPVPGPGPTWLDALAAVPEDGRERLYAAYSKIRGSPEVYERGIVRFEDELGQFKPVAKLPLEPAVFPYGHPARRLEGGKEYLYFGDPFPLVRTPATAASYRNLAEYEAYTPLKEGSSLKDPVLDRDEFGALRYAWRRNTPPVSPEETEKLVRRGLMKREESPLRVRDAETGKPVVIHRGTVHWNEYRKRWIMVATEIGGSSMLGEVWYAEAPEPLGPWQDARKIVTHDRYSFYNPAHHPEFDQEGGRIIYFEGTYTHSFSGNPEQTPRYDYNQVMYRLDLSDPRLRAAPQK